MEQGQNLFIGTARPPSPAQLKTSAKLSAVARLDLQLLAEQQTLSLLHAAQLWITIKGEVCVICKYAWYLLV